MPDQPSPRRRFQFRLRTLLLVVTLFAIPLGYVGSQAKIVRERIALSTHNDNVYMFLAYNVSEARGPSPIPWLRLQLGDRQYVEIELESGVSDSTVGRYRVAFPEADVHRVTNWWLRSRQRFLYAAGLRTNPATQP